MNRVEHTAEFLDLLPFISAGQVPIDPVSGLPLVQVTIPLQQREVWRARILPIDASKPDEEANWSIVREGQLVRVPLLPYRLSMNPPETMMAVMDIAQRYALTWPNVIRTHLVIGQQIQDLTPENIENFRIWIGFAARVE